MSDHSAHRLSYTIAGACDATGIGRTRVYELIGQGKLDARSCGGRTLITAESLHAFVASLPPAPIRAKQAA